MVVMVVLFPTTRAGIIMECTYLLVILLGCVASFSKSDKLSELHYLPPPMGSKCTRIKKSRSFATLCSLVCIYQTFQSQLILPLNVSS